MVGDLMLFQTYRKDKSIGIILILIYWSLSLFFFFFRLIKKTHSPFPNSFILKKTTCPSILKLKQKHCECENSTSTNYYMVHVLLIQWNLKLTSIKRFIFKHLKNEEYLTHTQLTFVCIVNIFFQGLYCQYIYIHIFDLYISPINMNIFFISTC